MVDRISQQTIPQDGMMAVRAKMDEKGITFHVPHSSEVKGEELSSWTATLLKTAFFGLLLFGVGFAAYRAGFNNGAHGVITEMEKYSLGTMDLGGSSTALALYDPHPAQDYSLQLAYGFDWDAFRQYFVQRATENNWMMASEPSVLFQNAENTVKQGLTDLGDKISTWKDPALSVVNRLVSSALIGSSGFFLFVVGKMTHRF